jgi:hypothetical protein
MSQFLFFSGSIDAYPGKGSNEVLDKHDDFELLHKIKDW